MMQPRNVPTVSAGDAEMPVVGYGTMTFPEEDRAVELISHALEVGYRHIDTARKYGSEHWVGEALRASGIPRDEVWVTTKVTEQNARADDFARSVETSLDALGLDHVDLLLIHWPNREVPLAETVGALARAKQQGLARNIGVSNFNVALLEEAISVSPEPIVCNQVEHHPFLPQATLSAACARHDVVLTCYAPVARGRVFDAPTLTEIGAAHGKSAAQVSLRFLVQHPRVVAVPQGLEFGEIDENIDIFDFELDDTEMERIGALQDQRMRLVDPPARRPVWDVD